MINRLLTTSGSGKPCKWRSTCQHRQDILSRRRRSVPFITDFDLPDRVGLPYNQWPQDLKDEYTYNPGLAKKLLADAGYPKGFKTHIGG